MRRFGLMFRFYLVLVTIVIPSSVHGEDLDWWTYQAYIERDGYGVDHESCDYEFRIYDSFSEGSIVGEPLLFRDVLIDSGSLVVFLRLESEWLMNDTPMFLEPSFRCGQDVAYTTLSRLNLNDLGESANQASITRAVGGTYTLSMDGSLPPQPQIQVPPPDPVPTGGIHAALKNRYVSFVPTNTGLPVAFRVRKTTAPGGQCWVQMPILLTVSPTEGPIYVAKCDSSPVYRPVWPEPWVMVGDCEIVPDATYRIHTNDAGNPQESAGISIMTAQRPTPKWWGDVAGANDGTAWTAPNLIANVNDVLAVLSYTNWPATPIRPTFARANLQGISSADPCLNAFVNTADVLAVVKAVAGDAYPFTTNPASCPVCP